MSKVGLFFRQLTVTLLVALPLELLAYPMLGVVLLFVKKDAVQLPRLFKWWDNHESYYNEDTGDDLDGLSGPLYYRERHGIDLTKYWPRYRARFNWLVVRNPLNYFHYLVLGAEVGYKPMTSIQLPPLVDIDEVGGYLETKTLDGKYQEYYYIIPYKFKSDRALKARWGWKLSSKTRPVQQMVFVINPFFKLG